jgi:hypothetical protein
MENIILYGLVFDTNKGIAKFYNPTNNIWVDALGRNISYSNNGPSTLRPKFSTNSNEGFEYYDTTLKKKILWNGTVWVNIDGSPLNLKKSGTTQERPSKVEIGFIYEDTTLNKLILWEGTKWVNLDGTDLNEQGAENHP